MKGAEEARLQKEQLARYLKWQSEEGGVEGPTHLSTWFKPHQQERLAWLKSRCVGTILEEGCNYGYVLAYCGGHIGVDWNPQTLNLARILSPEREFIEVDIRRLPFPDKYVDTVMICDVLEHLAWGDIPMAISEAKRIARIKVLITLPWGEKDTPEATSMKHYFLVTRKELDEISKLMKPCLVSWTSEGHFVLIEAWIGRD